MFSGIIESLSKVAAVFKTAQGMSLAIFLPKNWKVKLGESISVNGACLTVHSIKSPRIVFQLMPQTLAVTNLGSLRVGQSVNIERSLQLSDRISGHLVSGHVDVVGRVSSVVKKGNSYVIAIRLPQATKLLAPKGSVVVEGVSLTVVKVKAKTFTVHIVPYTWQHTNLNKLTAGSNVNIEFDILAKYIEQLMPKRNAK